MDQGATQPVKHIAILNHGRQQMLLGQHHFGVGRFPQQPAVGPDVFHPRHDAANLGMTLDGPQENAVRVGFVPVSRAQVLHPVRAGRDKVLDAELPVAHSAQRFGLAHTRTRGLASAARAVAWGSLEALSEITISQSGLLATDSATQALSLYDGM